MEGIDFHNGRSDGGGKIGGIKIRAGNHRRDARDRRL